MISFLCLAVSGVLEPASFQETLYSDWKQSFSMTKTIYEERSDFWNLIIFENPIFGKVLGIDGTIQLTENDEYMYHEMMAHVPLLTHPYPRKVLVIGGGDGGIVREVLKHQTVEKVILVELDEQVMRIIQKYMPKVPRNAFEDPRLEVIFQDASAYVKTTEDHFDLILCDSTDPIGPAAALFTSEFYGDCKNILKSEGIFVVQSGVPFLQEEELKTTYANRLPYFEHVTYYLVASPTYVGGFAALGWASDQDFIVPEDELKNRLQRVQGPLRYYTPALHLSSFSLPQYMIDILKP